MSAIIAEVMAAIDAAESMAIEFLQAAGQDEISQLAARVKAFQDRLVSALSQGAPALAVEVTGADAAAEAAIAAKFGAGPGIAK